MRSTDKAAEWFAKAAERGYVDSGHFEVPREGGERPVRVGTGRGDG